MSTDHEPHHEPHHDDHDEYDDDYYERLMGPPQEEPDDEPPLSLEEIQKAYDEVGGQIWELNPSARTVIAGLLQLMDQAGQLAAELDRLRVSSRHEYTVTDGPPPVGGAELVTGEQAELVLHNNRAKAVWQRAVHASDWHQLSSEPPF